MDQGLPHRASREQDNTVTGKTKSHDPHATAASFDGRISRTSYWTGFALTVLIFGLGRFALKQALDLETPGPDGAVVTMWSLLATVPLTALMVKRLNDRGRPAWIGTAAGAATALFITAPAFGIFAGEVRDFSLIEQVLFWGLLPLSLFALVEAGFLPGTSGANPTTPLPDGGGTIRRVGVRSAGDDPARHPPPFKRDDGCGTEAAALRYTD